jgi:hypothetical protein
MLPAGQTVEHLSSFLGIRGLTEQPALQDDDGIRPHDQLAGPGLRPSFDLRQALDITRRTLIVIRRLIDIDGTDVELQAEFFEQPPASWRAGGQNQFPSHHRAGAQG